MLELSYQATCQLTAIPLKISWNTANLQRGNKMADIPNTIKFELRQSRYVEWHKIVHFHVRAQFSGIVLHNTNMFKNNPEDKWVKTKWTDGNDIKRGLNQTIISENWTPNMFFVLNINVQYPKNIFTCLP